MNIERENIIRELNVRALPSADEIRQRVDFIKQQLTSSGLKALVLGISGGGRQRPSQ